MLAVLVFEMRYIFIIYCLAVVLVVTLSSWGFHAHRVINRSAVYTLPTSLAHFYKLHIEFISENSVNPDKRRYVSPNEAERHFIDIDTYGPNPFDSIPKRWEDAVAKFSEDSLRKHGIVPWQIHLSYYQLVEAFKKRNIDQVYESLPISGIILLMPILHCIPLKIITDNSVARKEFTVSGKADYPNSFHINIITSSVAQAILNNPYPMHGKLLKTVLG